MGQGRLSHRLLGEDALPDHKGSGGIQVGGIGDKGHRRLVLRQESGGSGEIRKTYRQVPGWVWLVLILIIVVLVLSTVFKLLSIFWPFIAVMAVVIFLMKLFRDWIN